MTNEKESLPSISQTEKPEGAISPVAPSPRQTRFLFKALGFLLFAFAAWVASCSYRNDELVDLTDSYQQQQLLRQAAEDINNIREATATVAVNIAMWLQSGSADTKEEPKSKPPETTTTNPIRESNRFARPRRAPSNPPKVTAPQLSTRLDSARAEYRKGEDAYAKTDPMSSTDEVQKYLYIAEPLFSRCLDLLDEARKQGVTGSEIENLEQVATKRLYDCRKRMALKASKYR
ncbi:MAG: hypothetical protein V1899_00735 [Planctomycetota bacterium]